MVLSYQILEGDCAEVMASMEENSVDAIATDPPYFLRFMGKKWDHAPTPKEQQVQHEAWAREAFRVLKPGGHMLAFGGTRTYHRLVCAIEDAGFEVGDTIQWIYGSGFPKSASISKHLDKMERDRWLKEYKALDNLDYTGIINEWKDYSETVKSAGLRFAKSETETGTSTLRNDIAPEPVLLSAAPKSSDLSALIAEFNSSDLPRTDGVSWRSVLWPAENGTMALNALVILAGLSPESPEASRDTNTSTAPSNALGWLNGNIMGRLKGAEALKIWRGSGMFSDEAATAALCVALTDDLKLITLSQSEIFRDLDTSRQMACVSATIATITESTAESLILYTVDTLKREALARANGAEREDLGENPNHHGGGTNNVYAQDEWTKENFANKTRLTASATDAAKQWDGWGTARARPHLFGTTRHTL